MMMRVGRTETGGSDTDAVQEDRGEEVKDFIGDETGEGVKMGGSHEEICLWSG